MTRKVFFGGSFDPPHSGHLGVARAAIASEKCDMVVWFPGFLPPHKQTAKRAPFADRLEMVKLLIADEPQMQVSDLENRLQMVPSYTLNILRKLREDSGETYQLLIGADSLSNLHTWYHAQELVSEFGIITYPRDGYLVTEEQLQKNWDPQTAEKLIKSIIPGSFFKISSTEVKFSMEKSTDRHHIINSTGLTEEITEYIRKNNLYR